MIYDTRKVPRWLTEKLLVARDFWWSKANTDSVMVLDIKSVVRSTTREHVKQNMWWLRHWWEYCGIKILILARLGFVFESICAKLVLYDFCCNWCLFNVFQCLSNVILCLFNTILCIFNAILCTFNAIFRLFNAILCLFVAKPDLERIYRKKLSKADISAIFKLSGKLSISI